MASVAGDYPQITYTYPQVSYLASYIPGTTLPNAVLNYGPQGAIGLAGPVGATAKPIPTRDKETNIVAKLIRYTVVDPEPILAEKTPELCVLYEGRRMLNGDNERGFLMDIAPAIATLLAAHNTARELVEYEDDEGRTKKLKATRLGQLDVVVEVIKEYAERSGT